MQFIASFRQKINTNPSSAGKVREGAIASTIKLVKCKFKTNCSYYYHVTWNGWNKAETKKKCFHENSYKIYNQS